MLINTKFLNVLFLVLLFSLTAMAQGEKTEKNENNQRQGGWWTIGINAGSSYQTSDVCSEYNGWGMGLTLAKNLYYRPGAMLAFDLRGRFLYANQKGQDWERSTGLRNNIALNGNDTRDFSVGNSLNYYDPTVLEPSYYYANHRTDLLELGLEGVINLNRLKEKTNVIVNLYGGLNLDWYKTKINQANDSGNEYNYNTITNADRATVNSELNSIMDNSYETVADGFDKEYGTFTWMPSAGIELGYQFTPRFSAVLGHKVTWSRADIMDGQQWSNDNTATGNNDLYHYTHLGLRWILEPGEKTLEPPIIKIIKPKPLPYATQVAYTQVNAEIENVQSASNVNCTFNGNNFNNFNFNPKSENFACNLNLVPGRNTLVINASNMAGQDTENVVIIYNEPVAPPTPNRTPPVVNITRPSSSGTTVSNPTYNLKAIVKHVDSRNDIRFILNGSTVSNYSYSFSTDKLEAALALQPGKNAIKITGKNNDGTDADQTFIIYEPTAVSCPDPIVNITSLSTPTGRSINMELAAIVQHVTKKSQINLYLNGNRVNNFAFNPSNGSVTARLQAKSGTNNVRLVANTDCGRDEDTANANYAPSNPINPEPTCPEPTVSIDNISVPVATPMNPNNAKSSLRATTRNVSSKNQIQLYVNGSKTYSFSFNAASGAINANLNLKKGNNSIKVSVSTNCGNDQDSENISFGSTTTPNPVVPAPLVDISTPNNGITTSNSTIKIVASVKHVDSKNNIRVTLNGVNYTSFSYSNTTKVVTLNNTPIRLGSNIIEIKATNNAGTDSDDVTIIRENNTPAPCPKPTVNINNISVPVATPMNPNNAKSSLRATATNVTSKNQIKLTVNGSNISSFTFNTATGAINANLNLVKGNNTIKLVVTNNCGSDQDSDNVDFSTQAPAPKPVVNITKPSNNASFSRSTTQLTATVKNVTKKKDVIVKVNGQLQTNFAFNANSGLVTATIVLNEGNNSIVVSASNTSGSDSDSKTVTYTKPVTTPKPVVNITKPSNNASFSTPSTPITATVKHVTNKKDVIVKVNGKMQTNFAFNAGSGLVTATIRLNEGKNTIVVSASNVSGSDSDSKSVSYVKPSQPKPPVVTIAKPTNKSTVKTNKVNLAATVKNVTKKSDVTVKLNGANISNFNFSGTSVTALLTVKEGNNNIVVIGKNTDGQDQASVTVKYVKATPPPTVKITKPAKTVKVLKPAFVVNATLTNVAAKKDVKFLLNGANVAGFTYNPTTGKLTATIRLKAGKNTIKVTGVNTAGQDSDTKIVNYAAVVKPKIEIQNVSVPVATPMNPNNAKSSVRAKAIDVTAKKDITLKVNNVKVTNFTFNKGTGIINAQLNLVKGKNTIFIEVKNTAGKASAQEEVNF